MRRPPMKKRKRPIVNPIPNKTKNKTKLDCAFACRPVAALIAALALFLPGCGKSSEAAPPAPTAVTRSAPAASVPADNAPDRPDAGADSGIKSEIETALEENKSGVFPKGVRLNSAEIKANVLTLDFNAAFNQVANLGDSGESDVQKELMRLAAQHSAVEKMRVTVNGKPFDSQATDWNTPFPVRLGSAALPAETSKAGR